MIPYGRPTMNEDDVQAVVEVLRSEWLTTGPKVQEFEEALAEYVGAKYAVSFSNGTAALHAAVGSLSYPPGSEIITTPMTFAATSNSILYSNYVPVFADIDEDTLLIDPQSVEERVTDKTRAILVVDYAGHPCNYGTLTEIANRHQLTLIADACHSLGAKYNGVKVGTLADMTTYSFHPVKLITTGEGGMVTTDNEDTAEYLKTFRNHGRNKSVMECLGFNYRLTDIQCALGISQLKRADEFLNTRRAIANGYDFWFNQNDEVTPLAVRANVEHAYHLYVVKLADRAKAMRALNAAGVATVVHYPPVHTHHKYYQEYRTANCPIAEKAGEQILSLPIYPTLSLEDQLVVIDTLMKL